MSQDLYTFDFGELNVKVTIEFQYKGMDNNIVQVLNKNILRNNLPSFKFMPILKNSSSDIKIYLEKISKKNSIYDIKFYFNSKFLFYTTSLEKISEDITKCIIQVAAIKSLQNKNIFMHAATLLINDKAVIIPGEGGTGKSTLSLLWLIRDKTIVSSETTVLNSNSVICGNDILSIKKETINYHLSEKMLIPSIEIGKYLFFEIPNSKINFPKDISGIVFIKLTEPHSKIKKIQISKERARMRLYESTYWILNGGFLLSHKIPGMPLATYEELQILGKIINKLSMKKIFYLEGSAEAIVDWIFNKF